MLSQVKLSRAMVELCRVKKRELDPWQSYVDSSRVKYIHGRFMQNQVEEGRAMVDFCRDMVEYCRVQYSEVEPWQSNVESLQQSEVEPWQSNVD